MNSSNRETKQYSICLLALTFVWCSNTAIADHFENRGESHLRMSHIKKMTQSIKQDSGIALIRFETAIKKTTVGFADPKRPVEKVFMPLTFVALDEADKWRIYIDGEFTLSKKFQGKIPRLGRRTESVPITGGFMFGRTDRTLERLRALTSKSWDMRTGIKYVPIDADRKSNSILLLGVWSVKEKDVFDGTFFGPFTDDDERYVSMAAKWLVKTPWPSIGVNKAGQLLNSSNPWELNIGLARLEDLKELRADHFTQAIEAAPSQSVGSIVSDMFLTAWKGNKIVRAGLTTELSKFFAKTKPAKQHRILKAVNEKLRNESYQTLVNLPALKNAARKYRRQIENDPARREVLREIDALLKIRGKVIAS